jgi:hypothetical protein
MNGYWKLPPSSDKLFTQVYLPDKDTFQLYHPSPQGPTIFVPRSEPLPVAPSEESGRALLGEWRRHTSDKLSTNSNITEVSEGLNHEVRIAGSGFDSYGSFTILGKANLSTRGLVFHKNYVEEDGEHMVWQYEGTFDATCGEIKGTCHPQSIVSADIPDPSSPSIPSVS